jgi:hypothetical protein
VSNENIDEKCYTHSTADSKTQMMKNFKKNKEES